jgi:hypothetical protein
MFGAKQQVPHEGRSDQEAWGSVGKGPDRRLPLL